MNNIKTDLKITDIKIYPFDIPLREVFQIATMNITTAFNVLIHITTNRGVCGWGEASSFHAIVGETQLVNFAAAKELKKILIGRNPLEIDSIIKMMNAHLPHNTTIKSAIDMALYDIASKIAELPLYLFLGGQKRIIETDMTIGICDPAEASKKALEIISMGFRIIKVKLGLNFEEDLLRLRNIRKAIGDDIAIRIDANQGWDRIAAVKNLNTLKTLNIEFCEQPCKVDDVSGLKYVSDNSHIPIMADESLFSSYNALDIITRDTAPYFNIKLSKSGGIHSAIKIAHLAESGSRPSMVGCMSESRLGLTAATHFGLSNDIIRFFDLDSHLEHAQDVIIGGISMTKGIVEVPDEIGIGAYPDPEFINNLEEVH